MPGVNLAVLPDLQKRFRNCASSLLAARTPEALGGAMKQAAALAHENGWMNDRDHQILRRGIDALYGMPLEFYAGPAFFFARALTPSQPQPGDWWAQVDTIGSPDREVSLSLAYYVKNQVGEIWNEDVEGPFAGSMVAAALLCRLKVDPTPDQD